MPIIFKKEFEQKINEFNKKDGQEKLYLQMRILYIAEGTFC